MLFCQIAVVVSFRLRQILCYAVSIPIFLFNMFSCPAPREIVIGADFDFFDFRVSGEEGFQCGRLFERVSLFSFLRGADPAKGQPVFVNGFFQAKMRHGFDGGFIHRQLFGLPLWGKEEAEPLVAAGHLRFEGLSFGVGAPQKGVPGRAAFILVL